MNWQKLLINKNAVEKIAFFSFFSGFLTFFNLYFLLKL